MGQKDIAPAFDGKLMCFDVDQSVVVPLTQLLDGSGVDVLEAPDKESAVKTIVKEKVDILLFGYTPGEHGSEEFLDMLMKKSAARGPSISFSSSLGVRPAAFTGPINGTLIIP